jgi:hypothetical protein
MEETHCPPPSGKERLLHDTSSEPGDLAMQ